MKIKYELYSIEFKKRGLQHVHMSQNPSFFSYKFFTFIFPYIVPKPEWSRASQLVCYKIKENIFQWYYSCQMKAAVWPLFRR